MSALKSLDTNYKRGEKKSLLYFLSLYILFWAVIFFFIATLYYNFQKNIMLQKKRMTLQEYSISLVLDLKKLHRNLGKQKTYPRDDRFKSAIYDSDKTMIFSLLKAKETMLDEVIYKTDDKIHYIKEPESYYLGAKYIVLEVKDDEKWLASFKKNVIIFGTLISLIVLVLGYFLLKLFLKPMRESILLLDKFIKDTTHELNTPVSAILANIETIEKDELSPKNSKKIKRVEIGARTISNIYKDLTYLILHDKIAAHDENVDISSLLKERVDYFKIIAESKRLNVSAQMEDNVSIFIDKNKISRLIDNLISNAIKYNKVQGDIDIVLKKGYLSIEDSGYGIKKEKLKEIFQRYKRFDKSVGGFGIGLNIVAMIAKEYSLKIDIKSEPNKGTKVILRW